MRRDLAEEDAREIQNGQTVVIHNDVSLSVLLTIGLDLEDQQYVLSYTSFITYLKFCIQTTSP